MMSFVRILDLKILYSPINMSKHYRWLIGIGAIKKIEH